MQIAVLAMFVMSGSGLLPGLLGALAKLDGEHSVGITREAGATVIVLGHRDETRSGSFAIAHRHSALMDVVVSYAASSDRESDHLIAFTHAEFSREYDESRPAPAAVVRVVSLLPPLDRPIVTRRSHLPVSPVAATAQLRTVVLLV